MRKINLKVDGFPSHRNPNKRICLTHQNPNGVRIFKSVQKYGRSLMHGRIFCHTFCPSVHILGTIWLVNCHQIWNVDEHRWHRVSQNATFFRIKVLNWPAGLLSNLSLGTRVKLVNLQGQIIRKVGCASVSSECWHNVATLASIEDVGEFS